MGGQLCRYVTVVAVLLINFQIRSTAANSSSLDECIVRLKVPVYAPLAVQARLAGTAKVTVQLNAGKPSAVAVSGVPRLLEDTIRQAIGDSEFKPCGASEIPLILIFRIEGEAQERPRTSVEYHGNGRFSILSPPYLPIPD